jgi:hypothetical protein
MSLIARKRVELERKLCGLNDEFERWRALCNPKSGRPEWLKHSSQIGTVTGRLAGFEGRIRARLDQAGDVEYLSVAHEMSKMVLAVHRIWQFFLAKLDQRWDHGFMPYLQLADELAWQCYQPILPYSPRKEPPLVFLNGGRSPFTLTREKGFEAEFVPRELISDGELKQAQAKLPFPVIGVPWSQITFLPELAVIAHEVGHSVEVDLDLESTIGNIIGAALEDPCASKRRTEWCAWGSELFADAWACLSLGPAFLGALIDFLAAETEAGEAADLSAVSHPPPTLRVSLNAAFLRQLGYDDSTLGPMLADWAGHFGFPAHLESYNGDARAISTRLFDSGIAAVGGGTLRSLVALTPAQYNQAAGLARRAIQRIKLTSEIDFRVMVVAARIAYRSGPDAYYAKRGKNDSSPAERLEEGLKRLLKPELRAGETRRLHDRTAEEKIGEAWFDEVLAALRPSSSMSSPGNGTINTPSG